MASAAYAWAVLIHLLSVTFLPFSLLAVGRYDVPAAAWVYGANMILLALSALAISLCAERDTGRARLPSGRVELCILIASAVLSIAVCSRRHTPCFPIFSILPLHSRHVLCMGDSLSKVLSSSRGGESEPTTSPTCGNALERCARSAFLRCASEGNGRVTIVRNGSR